MIAAVIGQKAIPSELIEANELTHSHLSEANDFVECNLGSNRVAVGSWGS